uniref:GNAT family N-acetyltransferase n=1 Tax=Ezakiella massiliensis TaxID=1852374 RepID=UPI00094E5168|nr:GNAT family N-acetyltransferase [Ezakiella massiliensis]
MCIKLKEIKTERLVLRSWRPDDLEDLYAFASVPGVGEMAGWTHHKSLDDSRQFLKMFHEFGTVYCMEYDGHAVGCIDFDWDKYKKDFISIGYAMSQECWGQGLMTEALVAIMDYMIDEYGVKNFCARSYTNNVRSRKLLMRLGFKLMSSNAYECYYELTI